MTFINGNYSPQQLYGMSTQAGMGTSATTGAQADASLSATTNANSTDQFTSSMGSAAGSSSTPTSMSGMLQTVLQVFMSILQMLLPMLGGAATGSANSGASAAGGTSATGGTDTTGGTTGGTSASGGTDTTGGTTGGTSASGGTDTTGGTTGDTSAGGGTDATGGTTGDNGDAGYDPGYSPTANSPVPGNASGYPGDGGMGMMPVFVPIPIPVPVPIPVDAGQQPVDGTQDPGANSPSADTTPSQLGTIIQDAAGDQSGDGKIGKKQIDAAVNSMSTDDPNYGIVSYLQKNFNKLDADKSGDLSDSERQTAIDGYNKAQGGSPSPAGSPASSPAGSPSASADSGSASDLFDNVNTTLYHGDNALPGDSTHKEDNILTKNEIEDAMKKLDPEKDKATYDQLKILDDHYSEGAAASGMTKSSAQDLLNKYGDTGSSSDDGSFLGDVQKAAYNYDGTLGNDPNSSKSDALLSKAEIDDAIKSGKFDGAQLDKLNFLQKNFDGYAGTDKKLNQSELNAALADSKLGDSSADAKKLGGTVENLAGLKSGTNDGKLSKTEINAAIANTSDQKQKDFLNNLLDQMGDRDNVPTAFFNDYLQKNQDDYKAAFSSSAAAAPAPAGSPAASTPTSSTDAEKMAQDIEKAAYFGSNRMTQDSNVDGYNRQNDGGLSQTELQRAAANEKDPDKKAQYTFLAQNLWKYDTDRKDGKYNFAELAKAMDDYKKSLNQ